MALEEFINIFSTFDTYIYPIIILVIWNFITTKKLKNKVFGDGDDPSEDGLAITVDKLTKRVTALEFNHCDCDDDNESD